MPKLTILLADNSMDKFYHGLVLAIGGKALDWEVKFFVTSQAVVLFTREYKGKSKMKMGALSRFFVTWQMRKLKIPDTTKMLEDALKEGVDFYIDEAGLKLAGIQSSDLMDGVKLSGSISFLQEAKSSDVVVTL
ncbi:peroxiredoxin [Candidatus Acidianus copahuensis]|uniref:Peroxiredoxin n=1 Tax=Candidatus Acidianus copahuensis TaxID=1160895 RepID=A0A031LPA4_9CREN|nr:DsrE/DsrF/DrsH-like family protein [Candidatus Acidianus copahuensis]EZQ06897.1 peroxiredoxin [Candidatus Acidianus copahuensis]